MKKSIFVRILSLTLVLALGLSVFAGCGPKKQQEAGVIYVGNTAGTTGALAAIGVPFNLGIEAAFAVYNAKAAAEGRTQVVLKHYDDKGEAAKSISLMEKLIFEDQVFAIVGNYGGYAVNVNLDLLKENEVPMVYAAAGIDALYNKNAQSLGDRGIFPVQPLNMTEGQALLIRAFADAYVLNPEAELGYDLTGGLGATKVGVISNQNEASASTLKGIKLAQNDLPASKKNNVVIQEVSGSDFSGAANAIVNAECDTVILTVIGNDFVAALTALNNAGYKGNVLTSYNNSSAAVLNDASGKITASGAQILANMTVYAQGWLDISSLTYEYKKDTALYKMYVAQGTIKEGEGVVGFNEEYWRVAENIYNYAATLNDSNINPWAMSYNSYALAGYIAGELFCKGLEALENSGKEITRANFVEIMESQAYKLAMADTISYAGGSRTGVEVFSLGVFYNAADYGLTPAASSATYSGLKSIEELKALVSE